MKRAPNKLMAYTVRERFYSPVRIKKVEKLHLGSVFVNSYGVVILQCWCGYNRRFKSNQVSFLINGTFVDEADTSREVSQVPDDWWDKNVTCLHCRPGLVYLDR